MDLKAQVSPLGERLARYRKDLGIGQRKAAGRAKVSESTVRNLEQGFQRRQGVNLPYTPTSGVVWAVAAAVGMPDSEVLELAAKSNITLDPKPPVIRLDLSSVPWRDVLDEVRRRASNDREKADDLHRLTLEVATRQSDRR